MFGSHFCRVPQGVRSSLVHSTPALVHTHLSHQTGPQYPTAAPKAASYTQYQLTQPSGLSLRLPSTVSFPILPIALSTAAPVLQRCKMSWALQAGELCRVEVQTVSTVQPAKSCCQQGEDAALGLQAFKPATADSAICHSTSHTLPHLHGTLHNPCFKTWKHYPILLIIPSQSPSFLFQGFQWEHSNAPRVSPIQHSNAKKPTHAVELWKFLLGMQTLHWLHCHYTTARRQNC